MTYKLNLIILLQFNDCQKIPLELGFIVAKKITNAIAPDSVDSKHIFYKNTFERLFSLLNGSLTRFYCKVFQSLIL